MEIAARKQSRNAPEVQQQEARKPNNAFKFFKNRETPYSSPSIRDVMYRVGTLDVPRALAQARVDITRPLVAGVEG